MPGKEPKESAYVFASMFVAACIGMFLFGVCIICLGSLMPYLVHSYQLNDVQSGALASVLAMGLMVGSISFGVIVDHYGYKLLFIVTTLCVQCGLLGISYTQGTTLLFLAFFIIGIGGGAINGVVNALVSEISEERKEHGSSNLTFLGIFYGLGALFVPGLLSIFADQQNYQSILALLGWFCFIPVLFFITVAMPFRHKKDNPAWSNISTLLGKGDLWLFGLFLMFHGGLEGIINNWSTSFLERVKLLGDSQALLQLTILVSALTCTRIILGFMLRKSKGLPVIRFSLLCIALGMSVVQWMDDPYWITGGMILLGVGIAASFPIILSYVGYLYRTYRGTAFSLVLVLVVLGNVIFNFLTGLLFEAWGAATFTWMTFALLFCMIISLFTLSSQIKGIEA